MIINPADKNYDGVAILEFEKREVESFLKGSYRSGNSRISSRMPSYDGIPLYYLISTGGGFIEGERYYNRILLKKKAHAIITTQTPNYIYKCDHQKMTTQKNELILEDHAILEYYLDEIIPYKNAYYTQETTIKMEKDSKLVLTDGITGGWSPDGNVFEYGYLSNKVTIYYDDHLLYNDHLICDPVEEDMTELGFFEGYTHFNSAVIIDSEITSEWINAFREYLNQYNTSSKFGLSCLTHSGIVLRVLGHSSEENQKTIWRFVRYYRETLYQYQAIPLKKFQIK